MSQRIIKVLLIDDEKDLCFFARTNLELSGGYKVRTANSGRAGLWQVWWFRPDIIVTDIMMPGMSGLEVLRRLKSNQRTMSIPVIMLTAKNDDISKVEAAGLYCNEYIVKPVEVDVLRSKISKVLDAAHV